MNDIKTFITIDLSESDLEENTLGITKEQIDLLLEHVYELISMEYPTQIKITNLPPRRSGFVKASDLIDIEKE